MVQVNNPESGLRNHRIDFARESDIGQTPSDPSFEVYSDTVTEVSWSSDAINEQRRGLGNADPKDFIRGPETHEVTVGYDLNKWFGSSTGDAAYDGLVRNSDNLLPNTHTFVDREDKGEVTADSTVSGNTAYSTRLYTVGRGGMIDEVSISGDPSDSQPISVELSYVFQKVRTYQFDQPSSSTELIVASTDTGDTTQSVTIEDEGASTSETVSLNGTTDVVTSSAFGGIDAVYLSAETVGDVEVYINSGTTTSPARGDQVVQLRGSGSYEGIEGDLGVPSLGAGSREDPSTLGSAELIIGDVIQRSASPVPHEIQSISLNCSNNIETTERVDAIGSALYPANRNLTMEATMYGETTTHDMLQEHLSNIAKDISWQMDGGTVTLKSAVLTDPGERAVEEGQAIMTADNTFEATGISFS